MKNNVAVLLLSAFIFVVPVSSMPVIINSEVDEVVRCNVEADKEWECVEAQRLNADKDKRMIANAQEERDRIARETALAMGRKFEMNNEELDNIRSLKIEFRKQIYDARAAMTLEIKQKVEEDAESFSKFEKAIEAHRLEIEVEIVKLAAETGRE